MHFGIPQLAVGTDILGTWVRTTISLSVCRCDETVEFNDFSALLTPNKVHMVPNTKHW